MTARRKIAVAGVTGLIGSGLPEIFAARGWETTGLSRKRDGGNSRVACWQSYDALDFNGHAAVVNLAGKSVFQRWTEKRFREIRESRLGTTRAIVAAIRRAPPENRPRVLINGSAVGIYGDRGDEYLGEDSAAGEGRLARLCREWEEEARAAEELGVRVVLLRTGIVLGKSGGAFPLMGRVFRCGLGGKLADGRQWMPWIHLADERSIIVHALEHEGISGALNACAPAPERNAAFTRKLASALHRPAVLPAPVWGLKLVLGGFGETLAHSQRAVPEKALETGFRFAFSDLAAAFGDLLER